MTQTQNPLWTDLLGFEDLDFILEIQKLKWDADEIRNRGIFWSDIAKLTNFRHFLEFRAWKKPIILSNLANNQ